MSRIADNERVLGGLWGAVVGNALGVPAEFFNREDLLKNSITGMIGFGTHNQPAGTWSNDSSLLICTAESLMQGFDLQDMGRRFVQWFFKGYWTPRGEIFDQGDATTREAIAKISQGILAEMAGSADEFSNGNGSLTRILPVALAYHNLAPADFLRNVHRASRLTHAHPRTQMACGFLALFAVGIFRGMNFSPAYSFACQKALNEYRKPPYGAELPHFDRIFSGKIPNLSLEEVQSSSYVMDTIEIALWLLFRITSYREAVLYAANLGGDTDTLAAIVGGLAGISYGVKTVPPEWIYQMPRRKEITTLFEEFVATIEQY